jgi:hypothetical protein
MAVTTRKVKFARINRRRPPGQETLAMRSFAEDLTALAESHLTTFTQIDPQTGYTRTWTAADMTVQPDGDFMTGILGFSTPDQQKLFDADAWSWVKGETVELDAATRRTMSPFAIDLRPSNRWVSFAPTANLRPTVFSSGLEQALNHAVAASNLIPTEWEVDLVTSRAEIDQWLEEHPLVHFLRRTVRIPNPGRDLDDDRAEMRALGARRKVEEFSAGRSSALDIDSDEFRQKLDGTQTGDLDLQMVAHEALGGGQSKFNSKTSADETLVDEFGLDLMRGMELVLEALQLYVRSRR